MISRSCAGLDAYENPERMANVQCARKLIDLGYDFIPGMKVSWVVTDASKSPQEVEPFISGVPFEHTPDYKYYAKRLAQMAGRVTEVYGWSEDELLKGSRQKTLFDGPSKASVKKGKKGSGEGPSTMSLDDFF